MTLAPMIARIERAYAAADAAERATGERWYAEAGAIARDCARLAPCGIGPVRAAAVIATLSPRVRWAQNVRAARAACAAAARVSDDALAHELSGGRSAAIAAAVMAASGDDALPMSCRKAARVLAGENPDRVLRGPKERAFWRNVSGDLHGAVTIDVWAARAAGIGGREGRLSRREHAAATEAYHAAAARIGEAVAIVQAVVWVHTRERASYRRGRLPDPKTFRPSYPIE